MHIGYQLTCLTSYNYPCSNLGIKGAPLTLRHCLLLVNDSDG